MLSLWLLTGVLGRQSETEAAIIRGDDAPARRRYPAYVPEMPELAEIEEVIRTETAKPRPKTRKVKRQVIAEVLDLVGSGLLANRPVPAAVYAKVEQALAMPDSPAIYAALRVLVERMVFAALEDEENDDEEAIMLLMAA